MDVVVDTNVPMVASGKHAATSAACCDACVQRLAAIIRDGGLLLDEDGLIVDEYLRNLGHAGEPGAGEQFVKWAFNHQFDGERCRRVSITRRQNGGWRRFEEFPADEALQSFDRSDQKFVAVALASGLNPPILNAVDSDWWDYRRALQANGVRVEFLCPGQFKGK